VKQKNNQVKLDLNHDVKMHQEIRIVSQTLMGKFHDRDICKKSLKEWMHVKWEPWIGNVSIFYILSKGWMAFIFQSIMDADKILNAHWKWGYSPLSIKRWSRIFDPKLKQTNINPIWVKLTGIPQLLDNEVFKEIGNSLGSFIEADMKFLDSILSIAQILVGMDLCKGLA
jgi:hypothetical protein